MFAPLLLVLLAGCTEARTESSLPPCPEGDTCTITNHNGVITETQAPSTPPTSDVAPTPSSSSTPSTPRTDAGAGSSRTSQPRAASAPVQTSGNPSRPAKPASTQVIVYQPTGFRSTQVVSGKCWEGSLAAPRQGAYRCMAGNIILDPCFPSNDSSVACPVDPQTNTGTIIDLTDSLPTDTANNAPPSVAMPWRALLQGGGTCGVVTGAGIAGFPLACDVSSPAWPKGSIAACRGPHQEAANSALYVIECGVWHEDQQQVTDIQQFQITTLWL